MPRKVLFQRQKHALIFVMNIFGVDDLKMSLYIQFIKHQGNYIFCIQSTKFIHLFIFFFNFFLTFTLHENVVPPLLSPYRQFISFYCQIFHFRKTETDILSEKMKWKINKDVFTLLTLCFLYAIILL